MYNFKGLIRRGVLRLLSLVINRLETNNKPEDAFHFTTLHALLKQNIVIDVSHPTLPYTVVRS